MNITPHIIRRTTAMYLLQSGVDISVIALWLGHESTAMTHMHGIAGNIRALQKVHRQVERYWRKMLNSRNREGRVTWEVFPENQDTLSVTA